MKKNVNRATPSHTVSQWFKGTCRRKKADGTALTMTTQGNAVKKTFDKRFANTVGF